MVPSQHPKKRRPVLRRPGRTPRGDEALQRLFAYRGIVIWKATVHHTGDEFLWTGTVTDEARVYKFFPITWLPDQSFFSAWRASWDSAAQTAIEAALLQGTLSLRHSVTVRFANGNNRYFTETIGIQETGPCTWELTVVAIDETNERQKSEDSWYISRLARCYFWVAEVSEPTEGVETELNWNMRVLRRNSRSGVYTGIYRTG